MVSQFLKKSSSRNTGLEQKPLILMTGVDLRYKGGTAYFAKELLNSYLIEKYHVVYIGTTSNGNVIKKLFKWLIGLIRFSYWIAVHKPQLIHLHTSSGTSFYRKLILLKLAKMRKLPVLVHIHGGGFFDFYKEGGVLLKMLVKTFLQSVNGIIVVANIWAKSIAGITEKVEKIYVVHNFINVDKFQKPRKDHDTRDCFTILYLGAFLREKGILDVIATARTIITYEKNLKFMLCGYDQRSVDLSNLNKDKELQRVIKIIPWLNDEEKIKAYHTADVFFSPSYYEAFGLTNVEAMASGLPIVTTNAGGIPEVVEDQVNGFLFNPGNIEGFTRILLKLMANKELRHKMSKINMEKAKSLFSKPVGIEKMDQIYNELIYQAMRSSHRK